MNKLFTGLKHALWKMPGVKVKGKAKKQFAGFSVKIFTKSIFKGVKNIFKKIDTYAKNDQQKSKNKYLS